jgi:hypothetical protein
MGGKYYIFILKPLLHRKKIVISQGLKILVIFIV